MPKMSLIRATKRGNIEQVKGLLAEGRDPNLTHDDGQTPLHWAARKGHLEVAELPLENCQGLDVTDENRRTPMHSAAAASRGCLRAMDVDIIRSGEPAD